MNERNLTRAEALAELEAKRPLAGNAEALELLERSIAALKRAGRKPKPAAKRRTIQTMVRFNAEELALVETATAPDELELAAAVRALALEAARARLAEQPPRSR